MGIYEGQAKKIIHEGSVRMEKVSWGQKFDLTKFLCLQIILMLYFGLKDTGVFVPLKP